MSKGVAKGEDGRKLVKHKRGTSHDESLLDRILNRIAESENGCILWTGYTHRRSGYGRIYWKGTSLYAHRSVYEMFVGPIPHGWDLGHKCHDEAAAAGLCDPVDLSNCLHRLCVNLDHLKPEPRGANVLASPLTQASINKAKTHCKRGHEFTEENTGLKYGKWRFCRTCNKMTPAERAGWDAGIK